MRRLIFILLLCGLLLPSVGFAAQAATTDTTLLNQVLAELGKHASVRAEFTQTRLNPALSQPQVSSGQLLFVLGQGMLWQVQKPYQETLALTGSRSARIDAQGQPQPMRSERGVSQISQMLQSMLSGKPDEVLRQFDVQASGTAAQWTLHFTPKQERMARVLGSIELDGDRFLEGIRIDMQDGTSTRIRFTGTRDANPLSALEKRVFGLP
jgi:outer membrane lipoprotein-sorting protein